MSPAKVVVVPSLPTVSVFEDKVRRLVAAPLREPMAWLYPLRNSTVRASSVTALPLPKALVPPAFKVPAMTWVAPL